MGLEPRLYLFLLLAFSLISYCFAEDEKVALREDSQGQVMMDPIPGTGRVSVEERRSLKVKSGAELQDYDDPSADPKHNPPPQP